MARGSDVMLKDVPDIKEDAHAGDFKVALSQGFTDAAAGSVADYVVTEQLAKEFDKALRLIRGAVRKNSSYAAYLHGSFGAGKSHFLTVLHAVLNGDPATRGKQRLREVIVEHDDWLPGKNFLMVPYHLVGAANLDSALLDGYVKTVRAKHPDAPTPSVYKADALLEDARALRESLGDEAFASLLPTAATTPAADDGLRPITAASADDEDLAPIGAVAAIPWTGAELDAAFAAPAGDARRTHLVSALLSGPMKSYATGKSGDAHAFVPLDDGLSEISKHARTLGYHGVVLFLDELILWLQARMRDRTWVNEEIQKLVKLIESGNADRPVPIVSFISRQRDLSQLVGKDILGSDVQNMEQALEYLKDPSPSSIWRTATFRRYQGAGAAGQGGQGRGAGERLRRYRPVQSAGQGRPTGRPGGHQRRLERLPRRLPALARPAERAGRAVRRAPARTQRSQTGPATAGE
ncbi:hypothetical protein [Streptomyces peucetius]|uniref:ATP-binding protein n=1 Tax=Streptomyces peucetius TaxID=1950 RepID=A0ABY6I6J5_STRPE|nr:hypothetical protein [Streptomyces peucetius]UYQ62615.1 hypothetical protein OGH68_14745 [Streptomyces peucetius]